MLKSLMLKLFLAMEFASLAALTSDSKATVEKQKCLLYKGRMLVTVKSRKQLNKLMNPGF